ncbi:15442_t:CDS:1, partial [Gigaspora margarita]
ALVERTTGRAQSYLKLRKSKIRIQNKDGRPKPEITTMKNSCTMRIQKREWRKSTGQNENVYWSQEE